MDFGGGVAEQHEKHPDDLARERVGPMCHADDATGDVDEQGRDDHGDEGGDDEAEGQ